jgi:hypothetical protein
MIPSQFLARSGETDVTVLGKSSQNYTATGLQSGTTYTAVVAAVDAYGNVGPSSSEVCAAPAQNSDAGGVEGACSITGHDHSVADVWPVAAALALRWGRRRKSRL